MGLALVVNLFGAPGSGKSTTRSGIFHRLKSAGVSVEEVTEFAKDLTWEKRIEALRCQPYVFGEQLWRMVRLREQVDVVVTDSPLLLSYFYGFIMYPSVWPESFYRSVVEVHHGQQPQLNFFIERVKPYVQRGRNETEEEAARVDRELRVVLGDLSVPFEAVLGNSATADAIAEKISSTLSARTSPTVR